MTAKTRSRLTAAAAGLAMAASAALTLPELARSLRAAGQNLGRPEAAVKQRIYGDFYRAMVSYLERIPAHENAVVAQAPGAAAHYFWVLNYYFLPRRIYESPAAGPAMEQALKARNVRHAIHTRPDGFFFDRWPADPAP